MKSTRVRPAPFLIAAVVAAAAVCHAQDAARTFQKQFGAQIRQARATPDHGDDVKLAKILLDQARRGGQEAEMTAAICQGVYDLGANVAEGRELAVEAMRVCAQAVESQAAQCGEKIVAVRRRQYAQAKGEARFAAGEELIESLQETAKLHTDAGRYDEALRLMRQAAAVATAIHSTMQNQTLAEVRRLIALDRAQRQAALLEAKLKSSPDDTVVARRLLDLYLVELDRPAKAAEFLRDDTDERLRTYVPLAAKDAGDLAEQACRELGNWYYSLSGGASTAAKPAMLRRAQTYLQRYVAAHDESDLAVTKVKLTLERIESELEKLAPPEPAGRWIDVLRLVDADKHRVDGRWWRKGSRVGVTAGGMDRILVPAAPKGDYEVNVQFIRAAGTSEVNIILPVAQTSVVLMLSRHGGQANGLSTVGGKYCDENPTRSTATLKNDVAHTVEAKVTTKDGTAEITAKLDGKELFEWKGAVSALACPRWWALPVKTALGLGTREGCTTAFTGMRMRMLSGRATRVSYTRPRDPEDWRRGRDDWRRGRGIGRGRRSGGRRRR